MSTVKEVLAKLEALCPGRTVLLSQRVKDVEGTLIPVPGSTRHPCFCCGGECVVSPSSAPVVAAGARVLCGFCLGELARGER